MRVSFHLEFRPLSWSFSMLSRIHSIIISYMYIIQLN
jgi:hypothetical protein